MLSPDVSDSSTFSRAVRSLPKVLGSRSPILWGTLTIDGIEDRVDIVRDEWGIPHITAETDADAWFAVGFCQGQDRTFQLESRLRMGRGLLASMIGKSMVRVDRITRRIGFRRAAQTQMEGMEPDTRTTLEAFCRGVNAGASDGLFRTPLEFALLRTTPTPYEPTDVLSTLGIMSFMLACNWDSELARLEILRADGAEALAAIEPDYPTWLDTTDPSTARRTGSAIDSLRQDAETFLQVAGLGAGSNNWAIHGSRTASGRPIVANDPHLSPDLPPHWYLAHVMTPEWEAAGASLIGCPGFIAGHNETMAWGVTAGCIDNTDLFIEELSADGTEARVDGGWEPVRRRQEVIPVRGGRVETVDVVDTARGPILTPDLGPDDCALSMSATWLQPAAGIRGFMTMHRAASVDEIAGHFKRWPALPINIVAADSTGSISWHLLGDAPIRGTGHGILPVPAWTPDAGWTGIVDSADLPSAINPSDGFVATANNKPTNNDTPWLSHDWLDACRVNRIRDLLGAHNEWTVDETLAMQLDRGTIVFDAVNELIASSTPTTSVGSTAKELLDDWDGHSEADSAAASVFELFVCELALRMTRAKAPKSAEWACGASAFAMLPAGSLGSRRIMGLMELARRTPPDWFGRGWPAEVGAALDAVGAQLVDVAGSDPSGWAWGEIRPLTLRHPLGMVAPLGAMFNRGPFPWGGSAHTINNGAVDMLRPRSNPYAIASMRLVTEVPDWESARFSLPGGQSGNPVSPHFDDLLEFWLRGEGVPIAWGSDAVREAAVHRMRLLPPS